MIQPNFIKILAQMGQKKNLPDESKTGWRFIKWPLIGTNNLITNFTK